MRIAYITRTVFGALGTSASYMLPKCVGKTHPVIVLAPNDLGSGETVVYENQAVNVIDIYHRNRKQQMAHTVDTLLEFQPDIIHLFYHKTCHHYPAMLRHLFPNTCWIVDFRSPLIIFESDFYKRRNRLRIKAFFLQFFIDAITATSIPILRTHLPLRFKPFYQLPFGIDLDEFPYIESEGVKPGYARRFVFTGNIARVRHIDCLVQGFAAFVHDFKIDAILDIYGTGNAVNTINRVIRENGMENSIKMKGVIPQIELFKTLCDYDAGIAYVPREQLDVAPSLKALEFAAARLH